MARRGSGLHLTKEGRKKLNFTDKLKKKQDEKKYQQNRNKNGSGTTTTTTTKKLTGKERAQKMARERIAAKKAGTYKKPKTAQELAKERLKIKNKKRK